MCLNELKTEERERDKKTAPTIFVFQLRMRKKIYIFIFSFFSAGRTQAHALMLNSLGYGRNKTV